MTKRALATVAAAALLAAPAFAQPPVAVEGNVRVEGVAPEKVLGAIDTEKLVDGEATVAATATQQPPAPDTNVIVETEVTETPTAVVETKTEVIKPVSGRPTLDPANPIAPEVQAVVKAKQSYTTADLVKAQNEAVMATPVSKPTTVIKTTTTIPK